MFDLAVGLIICTCIVCFTLHKGITITHNRNETYDNKTVNPYEQGTTITAEEAMESPTQKEIEAKMLSDMAALINAALFATKEDD